MGAILISRYMVQDYLWRPLRSNGQAIMFYSCDLFIIIVFRALILEAEERRPA